MEDFVPFDIAQRQGFLTNRFLTEDSPPVKMCKPQLLMKRNERGGKMDH